jgi:branched-chain amino acid transport system ATP-binding protein
MNDGSLDIRGVTVRFGGLTALDEVTLAVAPRVVTGIIGPNGAGKTTLLNVLCGFVRAQAGSAFFHGTDLARLRTHQLARLGVARTLQGIGLFSGLTVLENVMIGASPTASAGFWSGVLGLPRSDSDERRLRKQALRALERTGGAGYADAMPGMLAHGPRKRVALARALVAEPRLLLLDEPASGLDEHELPGLGELISDLASDATVVVIEHRMDLVMSVCEQIHVLDFGKLIASGTPEQVQSDQRVTAAYLGEDVSGAEREGGGGQGAARQTGQGPAGDRPASDVTASDGSASADGGGR